MFECRRASIIPFALLAAGAFQPEPLLAQDPERVLAVSERTLPSESPRGAGILRRPANLSVKDLSLAAALDSLHSSSGVAVAYSPSLLPEEHRVTCMCEGATIGEAIQELLRGTGLDVVVATNQLVISRRPRSPAPTVVPASLPPPGWTAAPRPSRFARRGAITGRVTHADNGEPLPGVEVSIVESELSSLTDAAGSYVLEDVPTGEVTVAARLIGYGGAEQTVRVPPEETLTVDFELSPQALALDELVVIGYGTVQRSDLTGSVSSISRREMNPGPVANASQLMQNTASGVVLMQGNAQPGADFNIRVRGSSSALASNNPLYVVDGLPLSFGNPEPETATHTGSPQRNPLNDINPNDIVSIEILKDASATAIYGSRGANGVVMITTRRGQRGGMQVDYSYSTSAQVANEPFEWMNAWEYAEFTNRYIDYRNNHPDATYHTTVPSFTESELAAFQAMGRGTDWQDEIQRQRGTIQNHQLSFSGASSDNDMIYYLSFGHYDHAGLMQNSRIRRYNARLNLDFGSTRNFQYGINFSTSYSNDDQLHFSSDRFGPNHAGFSVARRWAPVWPITNPDGSYFEHPVAPWYPNPVANMEIDDDIRSFRSFGTAYASYDIFDNLNARFELGGDFQNIRRGTYVPVTVVTGAAEGGAASVSHSYRGNYLGNLLLNFTEGFGSHRFDALLGLSYQDFHNEMYVAQQQNFPLDAYSYYNMGAGSVFRPNSSSRERNTLASSFLRLNYTLDDRFLFTLTARADGSSRFGDDNKWGFFPSAAFAWQIHNEGFMQNVSLFSHLKFRTSYGFAGNQEFNNYQALPLMETASAQMGQQLVTGVKANRPANPELQWETTRQIEVAVDYGFLNDRITGSIGVYDKLTSDLLQDFLIPRSSGFNTITANSGKIRNRGVEFDIRSFNLTGDVNWETSLNVAYNRNRWVDRAGLPFGIESEFGPLGGSYGYVIDGIFQTEEQVANSRQPDSYPGQYIIRDVRGTNEDDNYTEGPDGQIDTSDRVFIGYSQPDYTMGLSNTLSYRSFDLNIFLQGMIGHTQTEGSRYDIASVIGESRYNLPKSHFSLLNENGEFDYANSRMIDDGTANPYPTGPNNFSHEDASFVRLRNLTLGYTFPAGALRLRNVRNLRVYVDAQNLFLITNYSGINPENSSNDYPDVRTFSLGVNIGF